MPIQLDTQDLADLRAMIARGDIRDASGNGNNLDNPTWGAANQPFIRLTDAFYADGAAAARTTVNTPRQISDLVSSQDNNGDGIEESIANSFGGTALLTFFGQYFDHGLDFVAKGQPGSMAIGSPTFPISAARANQIAGTGIDPDAVAGNGDAVAAEHANTVSPYVDQNQAYGSHDAVTDLLRRWVDDGSGGATQTAYLLTGAADASGRALLPTLDDIRANYRLMTGGGELTSADISNFDGTGQALLIDFIPAFSSPGVLDLDAIGNYFVAGDGRANENVMLTTIHTVWARNHNYWVDQIRSLTGDSWSEAEYFEAARHMNIAEYQRVVFTEFAEAMAGGLDNDAEHGFEGYDPTVNAAISAEFAHAAYRFGHSMLNETVSYVANDGGLAAMSLVDAFLAPSKMADLGVDSLMAGAIAVEHQAIDVDVVNALRNQLVGRPLDLAALNIFRGRDTGVAPFNDVRADLYAATGKASLRPYEGWDDFQARNNLSNEFMATLRAAYPEGFAAMDLWVGGLAEKPMLGQLGSTFGHIFLEQLDRLQDGDRLYYLEIFDDSLFAGDSDVTFADIVMRNTGLTDLPDHIFMQIVDPGAETPDPLSLSDPTPTEGSVVTVTIIGPAPAARQWQSFAEGGEWTDIPGATGLSFTPGQAQVGQQLRFVATYVGDAAGELTIEAGIVGDRYAGTAGADTWAGTEGDDVARGNAGNDALVGLDGDDIFEFSGAGGGNDAIDGGAGDDRIVALAAGTVIGLQSVAGIEAISAGGFANVRIVGTAAAQTFDFAAVDLVGIAAIEAGSGNDSVTGSAGNDVVIGGVGDDVLEGGGGNDVFRVGVGAGIDRVSGGAGTDRIEASAVGVVIGLRTLSGVEAVVGFAGPAATTIIRAANVTGIALDFSATTLTDILRIEGGNSNDMIVGSAGNDVIAGLNGNDTLKGGGGDDQFRVGAGAGTDRMFGGDGDDSIIVTATGATLLLGSFFRHDGDATHEASSIEAIAGFGDGTTRIAGTTGADLLDFGGVDLMRIRRIEGGSGNDTLTGSGAADVIMGGAGADRLTGGSGDDIFLYTLRTESGIGTAADRIVDFTRGRDVIDLSAIDANGTAASDTAFSFVTTGFTGVRGQLRIDGSTPGLTKIFGDTDGNKVADFEIRLEGTQPLDATDFVL